LESLTNSQMMELFIAQFLNTGILILLTSINTYHMFDNFGISDLVGNGPHDDYTSAWYTQVGSGIHMTLCGTIGSSLFLPLSSFIVTPLFIWWFKKGATTLGALKELYVWPEFPLSARLAATNTIIFVIIMYGGTMPFMYFIGACYCLMAYWVDKWTLLRGSCQPPAYNEQAVRVSTLLFPAAGFIHVFATIMMYQPNLFPSEWSWFETGVASMLNTNRNEYDSVMDIWDSSNMQVREEYYSDWQKARLMDSGRKSCWLLLFLAGSFVFIWGSALALRWLCRPISLYFQVGNKKMARFHTGGHLRWLAAMKLSGSSEGHTTAESYDEGKALANEKNRLFSYKLENSKKYKDAYLALNFDPKETSAFSMSGTKSGLHSQLASKLGLLSRKMTHKVQRHLVSGGVLVKIESAKGLRSGDALGNSDPYCHCSVPGKPRLTFETNVVQNSNDPVWDYEHHLEDWVDGDVLVIKLWDKDPGKTDDFLGVCRLEAHKLTDGHDFDGELEIQDAGEGIVATLKLVVERIQVRDPNDVGNSKSEIDVGTI